MMDEIEVPEVENRKEHRLAKAAMFSMESGEGTNSVFPGLTRKDRTPIWSNTVDKLNFRDHDVYKNIIDDCRFFFRYDPLAKIIIQKMVDLAINDLIVIPESGMSKTELSIFKAVKDDILDFLSNAADEYLITGLVVPEIGFTRVTTDFLKEKNIKRTTTLMYPTDLWIRNSADIEIMTSDFSSKNSYYLVIPEKTLFFIKNGGRYPDGNEDKTLYQRLLTLYPDFVRDVLAGKTKILLENPLIVTGKVLKDSPYPIPYMFSALENMKHKRNLKKMDYSIAARVISAILQVKVGSDEFPVTEDDQSLLDDIEAKFRQNKTLTLNDIERVFTFVTNHTVELKWVFPEISGLLDQDKYTAVDHDILVSFGFPRILVTGETERSFSSDANIATLSPIQTLETMRRQLLKIVRRVFVELQKVNPSITSIPSVIWKPISLMSLELFLNGIKSLYETGNISRESFANAYGYDIRTEFAKRMEEDALIKELGIPEFMPVPHSNSPTEGGQQDNKPKPTKQTKEQK